MKSYFSSTSHSGSSSSSLQDQWMKNTATVEPLEQGCSFFTPQHYEKFYSYPLFVWLPSLNAPNHNLQKVLPSVSLRNYVGVAPCTHPPRQESQMHSNLRFELSDEAWVDAEERVIAAIHAAEERYNINPERIFLAGSGLGGTLALQVAMRHPESFAGVLSVNGAFPQYGRPLARFQQARGLPVLISSARNSKLYPESVVCEDLKLLSAAGLDVTLRQYPCGDELMPQLYQDINRWIMEIVNGDR